MATIDTATLQIVLIMAGPSRAIASILRILHVFTLNCCPRRSGHLDVAAGHAFCGTQHQQVLSDLEQRWASLLLLTLSGTV
jgi:hypothetical protein